MRQAISASESKSVTIGKAGNRLPIVFRCPLYFNCFHQVVSLNRKVATNIVVVLLDVYLDAPQPGER